MKSLSKIFIPIASLLAIQGCGGGGGSSGSVYGVAKDSIAVTTSASTISTNNYVTINVTVRKSDGTSEIDGTTITASLSPSSIGTIAGPIGSIANSSASNTLSGGATSFIFNSTSATGTATITFTVPPINSNPNSVTATTSIGVTAGTGNDPRLVLTASTLTLPLNPYGGSAETYPFPSNYIGSPYISEVGIQWRHTNGQLVSGTSKVNVSITPVTIAGFSTLDDPTTTWSGETKSPPTIDGNEFLTILGSGPVNVTGGVGTVFVHADDVPGSAVLTVTGVDLDYGEVINSQLTFTVTGGTSNELPASVTISQAAGGVYVNGSGGAQSTVINAQVLDGDGAFVANPATGIDNVKFEIVGPAGTDATLSAKNAAGTTQTAGLGSSLVTSTLGGQAAVAFNAGTVQGAVQVKVTVDKGDNNVDNDIQDALSATASVVVSDGKLFSLVLDAPDGVVSSSASVSSTDGSYSVPLTATATDKGGNPVIDGTVLSFGSIDSPQSGLSLQIRGTDGNPSEGAKVFDAPTGKFTTTGGGVQIGDTLVVFGKTTQGAPSGNADLESAVKVTKIISSTEINVATAFNFNDGTGSVVNAGAVLPYYIGRATLGSVLSPVVTTSGVAATNLIYSGASLGLPVVVWAQGTGTDSVSGSTLTVTDAALTTFPGIPDAQVVVSPNPIPGNFTATVDACVFDGNAKPIQGVKFSFLFSGLNAGTGKVNGIATSGTLSTVTDSTGCVSTTVVTSGLQSSDAPTLTFSSGTISGSADIVAAGSEVLTANPSAFVAGSTGGSVSLTLTDSGGTGIGNILITGSCTASTGTLTLTTPPGVTSSSGVTTTVITSSTDAIGACTFTTPTGSPSATVSFGTTCTFSPCG